MKRTGIEKYALLLLVLGAFILFFAHFNANSLIEMKGKLSNDSSSTQGLIGTRLASFAMRDINGKLYSTQEQITGRCLFVFFSASDCITCLSESKYWQMLHISTLTTKVFGVTRDENLNKLRKFLDIYNITFPILYDQQGNLFNKLKIEYTPIKVLVDANKFIRKVDQTTYLAEEDFKRALNF